MTTQVKSPIWAGPFVSGEKPLSIPLRFDESDVDFTGYAIEATLLDYNLAEMVFDGSVAWTDESVGLALLTFGADDVTVPVGQLIVTRRCMVWAGNGTNRVATLEIKYNCHPAIGTPPVI